MAHHNQQLDKILISFGDRVRELPLRTTRSSYTTPLYNPASLKADKKNLPLIKGFLYNGDTYTNKNGLTKKRPSEALITLDVDDNERALLLAQAVRDSFPDHKVFLSTSASGRPKAHFFVDVASFQWLDVKQLACALITYLGLPSSWLDLGGVSQCFLTESLAEVLSSKVHWYWTKEELSALGISTVREVKVKEATKLPWKPTKEHTDLATTLLSGNKDRNKSKLIAILAYLLSAPRTAVNAVSVSQNSLASSIGLSQRGIGKALTQLEKTGLIAYTRGSTSSLPSFTLLLPSNLMCHTLYCRTETPQPLDSSLSSLIERYTGVAVPGGFNKYETLACLAAVREGVSVDTLIGLLASNWSDWDCPRRQKRVAATYRWATRKLGKL